MENKITFSRNAMESIEINLPFDYWVGLSIMLCGKEYWFCLKTKYGHKEIKTYKSFNNGKAKIAKFLSKF